MTDANSEVSLMKEDLSPGSESSPSYKEPDMATYPEQYNYMNQPSNFGPQQQPNFSLQQPPSFAPQQQPNFALQQQPNFPLQQPLTAPIMPASPVIPLSGATSTATSISVGMPALASPVPVGPKSMQMRCFHCQAFIQTKINKSAKSSAHIACCLLFIFSCGICSCLPYCMSSCKKVDHSCPNCNSFLGSYNA